MASPHVDGVVEPGEARRLVALPLAQDVLGVVQVDEEGAGGDVGAGEGARVRHVLQAVLQQVEARHGDRGLGE